MFLHVIVRSSPCCECLSVPEVYSAIQWIIKVFYFQSGKMIRLSFHQDITGAYFFGITYRESCQDLKKKMNKRKKKSYNFDSLVLQ